MSSETKTKQQILEALSQPFEPEDVKWLPGSTNKEKTMAQAMAYADPRAYIDRLNTVVGPDAWTKEFRVHTVVGLDNVKEGWGDKPDKVIANQGRIIITCRVIINGIGATEDVGESDLSDPNAATVASAQAFKRACVQFGLGRYLYDLPRIWCEYDKTKKQFKTTPELPEWALPSYICEDTGKKITAVTINGKTYSPQDIVKISKSRYGKVLSIEAMSERGKKAKTAAQGNEENKQQAETAA